MAMAKPNQEILEWFEQLPCSVTVCDKKYKILYLNKMAAEVNRDQGGKALVGKNLLDCHPRSARLKLRKVMASGRPNAYTIEKDGIRKQIYQSHWRTGGRVGGLVELSFEIPIDMPHHKRN